MKVYGITGGAGSGKSEVIRMLRDDFGGYVILADEVSRKLTYKGNISYGLILDHFGKEILGPDGEIDRKRLADIVFNDEDELACLNSMTHPYVKQEIISEIARIKKEDRYPFIALEAALLLESGYENICDEIWYVYTSPDIRRERMKQTRGYSDEKVDSVMANQLSDKVFFEKCQFVIKNNDSLDAVYAQLSKKLSEGSSSGS